MGPRRKAGLGWMPFLKESIVATLCRNLRERIELSVRQSLSLFLHHVGKIPPAFPHFQTEVDVFLL
jgi:hypothetical protein